jgi:hypothetical protein
MDRRRAYKDVSSLVRADAIAVHKAIAQEESTRLGREQTEQ